MKKRSRTLKASRLICMLACGLAIAFTTWLLMRVATTSGGLAVEVTYKLPKFASLENLPRLDTGTYAVAIDGEIVAGQKSQEIRPTASMAKMILALAVMQEKPFNLGEKGEIITINDEFYHIYQEYLKNDGSTSAVEVGEEISEYDALVSVMLASSNNMADTLAIWAFGSLDDYQDYANEMLGGWGLGNTRVGIDASGFDESTTSSASDLAKIGTRAMMDPILGEIVSLQEYEVPVAGKLANTNAILGQYNISGVKTGYAGDASGYCLTSGYREGNHIIVTTLMGAPSREVSFTHSLEVTKTMQSEAPVAKIVSAGDEVGYLDSWWTGKIIITATEDVYGIGWNDAITNIDLNMTGQSGMLKITIGSSIYNINVSAEEYNMEPSLFDKVRHAFGWQYSEPAQHVATAEDTDAPVEPGQPSRDIQQVNTEIDPATLVPITGANSDNCTIKYGSLMLVNPNFPVETDFIAARKSELVSIYSLYGIVEGNPGNGDNLLDADAATHINDMVKAYEAEYPGHTLETRSCFRAVGTNCGRLCASTGESDHHTGLTCDLLDPSYGEELNTDNYAQHVDWQWLKANSYKYGFIDRFPEAWAGGSMSDPLNVDENGSTGLYETWHYRYVGIEHATNIATGKYNNREYDSLEHYLKARGLINDLKAGVCK